MCDGEQNIYEYSPPKTTPAKAKQGGVFVSATVLHHYKRTNISRFSQIFPIIDKSFLPKPVASHNDKTHSSTKITS